MILHLNSSECAITNDFNATQETFCQREQLTESTFVKDR